MPYSWPSSSQGAKAGAGAGAGEEIALISCCDHVPALISPRRAEEITSDIRAEPVSACIPFSLCPHEVKNEACGQQAVWLRDSLAYSIAAC